jgi:hypothetical protein
MTRHIGARAVLAAAFIMIAGLAGCTAAPSTASGPPPTALASSPSPSFSYLPSRSSPPSPSRTVTSSGNRVSGESCSVSVAVLNRLLRANQPSSSYRLRPGKVQCWRDWAWGFDPNCRCDANVLFRNISGKGWRFVEGWSALECKDLGIHVDPKDPPPFCG